jgi:RimJ/RimL family protein N-acetyltransferase
MFARTPRLFLRPGWAEDAPALAALLNDSDVSFNLTQVPHPYTLANAMTFLKAEKNPHECFQLIFRRAGHDTELIGGIGLKQHEFGVELGYWLARPFWGQGYATEAGQAVLDIARYTFGLQRVVALHGLNNSSSGHVLRKLGFRATGHLRTIHSIALGQDLPCAVHELKFVNATAPEFQHPMAA